MHKKKMPAEKLCVWCDKPISPARLEALPGITSCIDCARKHNVKYDTSHIEVAEASQIDRTGFARSD